MVKDLRQLAELLHTDQEIGRASDPRGHHSLSRKSGGRKFMSNVIRSSTG
jgi:hypothetical protein